MKETEFLCMPYKLFEGAETVELAILVVALFPLNEPQYHPIARVPAPHMTDGLGVGGPVCHSYLATKCIQMTVRLQ